MHDLRYLALALIGFFLALATGLLLGSALNSPDRKDRIYEGLRVQFDGLRSDIQRVDDEDKRLKLQVSARDQAGRQLLPLAVRGRLAGANVAVVVCGPLDERPFWGPLEDALKQAGAATGMVVHAPDELRTPTGPVLRQLRREWGAEDPSGGTEPFEAAGWVARAIHRGATADQWAILQRETGLDIRSVNSAPTRLMLILSAVTDEARADAVNAANVPELKLVEAAQAEQMRVVACEPEGAQASVVDALARRSIPTVDNIDTPFGQIAAVLALAGADGRFGSKSGAGSAVPPLESR